MATFRKHTHDDFKLRIKRLDPAFHRDGHRPRPSVATEYRPLGSVLLGFGWAYLVISVGSNKDVIEQSLQAGSLASEFHGFIFMALAALLAVSTIVLGIHICRFFMHRGGKRKNSGALLVGVMGALALVYTPSGVWRAGYGMLDENSRTILMAAHSSVTDALPGVDLATAKFVSSYGK